MIFAIALCCAICTIPVPALTSTTQHDVEVVRALVDQHHDSAARTRWEQLTGWTAANGATAYGRADAAFSGRDYRPAFRIYDAILFCGSLSELSPQAHDSGAAAALDRALNLARTGRFRAARQVLERAARRDPNSIESRYFLGLVAFACGDSAAARSAWKAAIDSDGYAQPPDGWTLNRARQAALQRYLQRPAARIGQSCAP